MSQLQMPDPTGTPPPEQGRLALDLGHGIPFLADHGGVCGGCDGRIREGDLIARLDDTPYVYCCSDCGEF